MKHFMATISAIATIAAPAGAQDNADEGLSLMEEGAKMIMRHLMDEMGSTMEDLDNLSEQMAPALQELQQMINDLSAYEMPEMLPNGDIIIRRKTPLEVVPPSVEEIEI